MTQLAREVMHANPLTVSTETPVLDIQHLLVSAAIGALPVTARDGAVMGIVTASDVLRAFDQALDDDIDEGESDAPRELLERITAADIATPEVIWVSPDAEITTVAQVMRDACIHRVLVGTHGRLEGILTAFDLLRTI